MVVQGKGFGFSWASGHGQHTLDKHDRDTLHHIFLAGCHVWPHFPHLDEMPCIML